MPTAPFGTVYLILDLDFQLAPRWRVFHDAAGFAAQDNSGAVLPLADPQPARSLPAEATLSGETSGLVAFVVPRAAERVTVRCAVEGGRRGTVAWTLVGPRIGPSDAVGTPGTAPTNAPPPLPDTTAVR